MAAALGVGALAQPVSQYLGQQAQKFEQDPWDYVVSLLMKGGIALLASGLTMGTLGYFLKASATASLNNEINTLTNMGTVFSNIRAPTFTPAATGTAPLSFSLQGIQNFANDAWQDAQAAGSDLAQTGAALVVVAEDVANGIVDIAKVIFSFVQHFPDILWNALVAGIGGGISDILNWAFPWFVIMGGAMLLAALVIKVVRKTWDLVAAPAWARSSGKWALRQESKLEASFDRLFGNFKHEVGATVAPEPEIPVAALPAPPEPPPEPVPAAAVVEMAPEVSEPVPVPESPPEAVSVKIPEAEIAPEPVIDRPPLPEPAPGVMTQTEAETYLGDRPNRAPTPNELLEMYEEAEKNRRETAPEPEISGYEESRKAADAFAAAEAGE